MSMMKKSLIATASILLCRFTGLARMVTFNVIFGAGELLDAFNNAFRIPNLLRDLFAEGALSQSYTSVTAKVKEQEGDQAAWEVTHKVATQLVTLMVAIVTAGILLSSYLIDILYTKSPSAQVASLATGLCQVMWPFILLASLSALTMGTLNILGVFGLPMLASAAFNIVTVVAGLLLAYLIDPNFLSSPSPASLYGFAFAVLLGGFAQWAVQLPKLRQFGFKWRLNFKWKDKNVYKIWFLMLPAVLASGTTQFNVFINTYFANSLQAGSVTALLTAFQLWQLPVGLFGVATGMVVLPSISRMMVNGEKDQISEHIARALRFVAFFAVPSFIVLGLMGEQIVSIIFQFGVGRFTVDNVQLTGSILGAYSLGLLGYAGTKVIQPIFLALEKRWIPLIVALTSLSISVSLNYYFVKVLNRDASWLALTTSVITTFNFLFYFIYLRKQLNGMCGKLLISGLSKIIGAGIPFALICIICKEYFMQDFTSWNVFLRILVLGSVLTAGGLSYLAFAWLFKTPELVSFKDQFLKKFLAKR